MRCPLLFACSLPAAATWARVTPARTTRCRVRDRRAGQPRPERGALSAELGGLPEFSDYYEALKATRPDVVSINTYPETHGPYARAALEAGCHVFCEKPLAETVEEAQSIVDAARRQNRKLVIGYILRVHPAWSGSSSWRGRWASRW